MIDTLNLKLDVSQAGGVDFLSETPAYLDDAHRSEHCFDGYWVVSGYLGSLKVSISRMAVTIKDSSFCKWYLGTNLKTLTRADIQHGIEKLSDTLHLPMNEAIVTRLDIGQNIITKSPIDVYLNHLGQLKGTKRLPTRDGLYYSGIDKQIVFYDKVKEQRRTGETIPELYRGRNVLRYEVRYLHHLLNSLNVPEVTGSLLYNEDFYISIVQRWSDLYKNIQKINDIQLNFEIMGSKKDLYRAGLLSLIEQRGGQIAVINEINEAYKRGQLTAKQAHDMRDAVNSACKVGDSLTKPNDAILELDKKIDEATRFFR